MSKKQYSTPRKQDWESLSLTFARAAKGKPAHLREAAITAKKFDNQFGTDFIGIVAQAIRQKPKYVRQAKFTKSDGTLGRAKEIFKSLAVSFPVSDAAELSMHSRPRARQSQFAPPVARQVVRGQQHKVAARQLQ